MLIPLKPAFQSYLWGGEKLKTHYQKETDLSPLAESWELSARTEAPSVVADGKYQGSTFPEYLTETGQDPAAFPLLIKLIDAKEKLSVQVHPNDEFAAQFPGEEGKTEMWVVLEAEPGAGLIAGLNRPVTREELAEQIQNNTLEEILQFTPVQKGDVFFIPPGTIHAIGAGLVIAEIQQNSNTTYRLYDYGRRDKDGNLRPLHLEKGTAAATLSPSKNLCCKPEKSQLYGATEELLVSCPYFTVHRHSVLGELDIQAAEDSFLCLLGTEGKLTVSDEENTFPLLKGNCIYIPAGNDKIAIRGTGELLIVSLY